MKVLLSICLAAAICEPIHAQPTPASPCLPKMESEPRLAELPQESVTFQCQSATPLDLIHAIGFQTRMPIGLVLGEDPQILSKNKRAFNLQKVQPRAALDEALHGTGYTIAEDNGVTILMAPDLTQANRDLLDHRFTDFNPQPNQTMAELAAMLTMCLQAFVDPQDTYAWSLLQGLNDEHLNLRLGRHPSTEEIANEIVTQGSAGMWTLKITTSPTPPLSKVDFSVEPYRHYTDIARQLHEFTVSTSLAPTTIAP